MSPRYPYRLANGERARRIYLEVYITEEEDEKYRELARADGSESVRDWLLGRMGEGILDSEARNHQGFSLLDDEDEAEGEQCPVANG